MSEKNKAEALDQFIRSVRKNPWSTLAKSELEFLIFELLADTGEINPTQTDMQLDSELETTPTRIRNLRFKYEQKKVRDVGADLYLKHIVVHEIQDNKAVITLASKYLRERLVDELQQRNHLVEQKRNDENLVVDPEHLFETIESLPGHETWRSGTRTKLANLATELKKDKRNEKLEKKLGIGAPLLTLLGTV